MVTDVNWLDFDAKPNFGISVVADAIAMNALTPTKGRVVYRSDLSATNPMYGYDGAAWVALGGGGIGDFLANGTVPMTGTLQLGANTLTTSNTGLVSNLNADRLDGNHASAFALDGDRDGDANTASGGDYSTLLAFLSAQFGHTHAHSDLSGTFDADTLDNLNSTDFCRIGSTDNSGYVEFASAYGMNWNNSTSHGIRGYSSGNLELHAEIGTGDDINCYPNDRLYVSGDIYTTGNMSALSITDRTPFYEGNALEEIKKIKGTFKDGIDHSTLPTFVKAKVIKKIHQKNTKTGEHETTDTIETDERNIGNMISILTVAVQQLTQRIEQLEAKHV